MQKKLNSALQVRPHAWVSLISMGWTYFTKFYSFTMPWLLKFVVTLQAVITGWEDGEGFVGATSVDWFVQ